MPPVNSARVFLRALSTVAVLALVGCGGDEAATAPSTTTEAPITTTTEASTTTTTTPEDAVIAGLQAAMDAYVAASATSDPDHPQLLATTTGPGLETVQRRLADYRGLNVVSAMTSTIESAEARVAGATATVDACLLESSADYDLGTEPPAAKPPSPHRYAFTMAQESGAWKLSETNYKGRGCDE